MGFSNALLGAVKSGTMKLSFFVAAVGLCCMQNAMMFCLPKKKITILIAQSLSNVCAKNYESLLELELNMLRME